MARFPYASAQHELASAALQLALCADSEKIRQHAAMLLGFFDSQSDSIAHGLTEYLDSPRSTAIGVESDVLEIIATLEKFGPQAEVAAPALKRLEKHANGKVRKASARARAVILQDELVIGELINELEEWNKYRDLGRGYREPRGILQVLNALTLFGSNAKAAVPALIAAADDNHRDSFFPHSIYPLPNRPRPYVGVAAIQALGAIGPDARTATTKLREILNRQYGLIVRDGTSKRMFEIDSYYRDSEDFQVPAALALSAIGPDAEDAIPDLIAVIKNRRLEHPDRSDDRPRKGRELRRAAILALSRTAKPDVALPPLIEVLHRNITVAAIFNEVEHIDVTRDALKALDSFGPSARSALPTLEKLRSQLTKQFEGFSKNDYLILRDINNAESAYDLFSDTRNRVDALLEKLSERK